MSTILFHCIGKKKLSGIKSLDDYTMPEGVSEIILYGLNLKCLKNKKRRFIIELHDYESFAMLKFYPSSAETNPKKYALRGIDQLGYRLPIKNVFQLIFQCALIMRDYLDRNPHSFIGYVGQTDFLDEARMRRTSQRSNVYNILTSSIFTADRYKHSSKVKFDEVNLRLIRKVVSKQNGKLTKQQMKNYNIFLTHFNNNAAYLYEMMTPLRRKEVIEHLKTVEKTGNTDDKHHP